MLTIFTPTYNRAYILRALYTSLCKQTNKTFEWLIVDDGSTDETRSLVEAWQAQGEINIRYFYQGNSGKSVAHNKGVKLAEGDYFTCVDSDDHLAEEAVEIILKCTDELKIQNVGIVAYRYNYHTGMPITKFRNETIETATLGDLYEKHGMRGDTMLIFRSEIIKKHQFPCFDGEKFVPEAYLYDRIDREGTLRVLPKCLYACEYLADGYTTNMSALLYRNPNGYMEFIKQRLRFNTNIKQKFQNSIRYVAMAIAHDNKRIIKDAVYSFITIAAYLPGYLLYCRKYKKIKKQGKK